jgi:hypothetical protein
MWSAVTEQLEESGSVRAAAAGAAPAQGALFDVTPTDELGKAAADLKRGKSIPGQDSGAIAQLSRLLKALGAYPPEAQGEKYRNPQGVYLKLMNLRAVQTGGAHGMNAYSQLDAAVWRDYIDNLEELHAEAAAIRQQPEDGVLTPTSTTAPTVEDVDIEQQHTERFMVSPSGEPREAERAEQRLVLRYQDYMAAKGVTVSRKRYRPTGQVRPMSRVGA